MKWVRAFSDYAKKAARHMDPSRKGRWQALQRQNRMGQSRQFGYVYRRGKKASCKELSLLYARSNQKRVGFSINKKVGVAVIRNRTKRRLRECVRPLLPQLKNGLYVIVARPSAADCSFAELNACVTRLLRKVEAFSKQEKHA